MLNRIKVNLPLLGFTIFLCGMNTTNGYIWITSLLIFLFLSISTIRLNRIDKNSLFQLLFLLLVSASYFWSPKIQSLKNINMGIIVSICGILYSSIFMYRTIKSEKSSKKFQQAFIISAIFVILELLYSIPVGLITDYSYWDDFGMNKNDVGMKAAWGALLSFYDFYAIKSKNKISKLLFVLFSFIVLLSSSRKAILILFLSIVGYLCLSENGKKRYKNILFVVVLSFFITYLIFETSVLYNLIGEKIQSLFLLFSNYDFTSSEDYSIYERRFFKEYALGMFMTNFKTILLGNGLNAFHSEMFIIDYSNIAYSHCNYTELLCNYGLIGFIIFYFYKIKTLVCSIYKKGKTREEYLYFIILSIMLVFDYGYVSYYSVFDQLLVSLCVINLSRC